MAGAPKRNWGLRAAVCAAVVVWQIYEMARASVSSPSEGNALRYLILAAALFGLVFSLLKLGVDY